jgi:hypothetical protein
MRKAVKNSWILLFALFGPTCLPVSVPAADQPEPGSALPGSGVADALLSQIPVLPGPKYPVHWMCRSGQVVPNQGTYTFTFSALDNGAGRSAR